MKLKRRETEIFSLSFMDCICCGFGAIILLLVLTEVDQPVVIERARDSMNGQLLRLQQELFVIRGDTDQLNRELAPFGLMFGPDVATASRATLGGMIGNNSTGSRSVVYGQTVDHVRSLTAVLSDGTVGTFGPAERTSELPPFLMSGDGKVHLDSEWSPPKEKDEPAKPYTVNVWVVVRDERAGAGWLGTSFTVTD